MRWLRAYLVLSGLVAHALLAGVLLVEWTAGRPMLRPGLERVAARIAKDHPAVGSLIERLRGGVAPTAAGSPGAGAGAALAPPAVPFAPVPIAIETPAPPREGRVLRVGPGRDLAAPSAAAKVARDGDTVLIAPGVYTRDVAIWRASDLLIRGDGGMAVLDATGTRLPQDKAIWVIQGSRVRVENVEFTGAASRDRNGAGIRAEGTGLHVVNSYFHDNQEGILTGSDPASVIVIEHSEFARNGHRAGKAHNLYVGRIKRLVFRFNYVHRAVIGSNLKSRAEENFILYNRILDYGDGEVNYGIDLSNGGLAFVIGNVVQQGPRTQNYHLLAFAPEGAAFERQALYVVNNTFVNDRAGGRFIRNGSKVPARIYNNLLVGPGEVLDGPGVLVGNVLAQDEDALDRLDDTLGGMVGSGSNRRVTDAGLAARLRYDYRLRPDSPAVDAGAPLDAADGFELTPRFQPVEPRRATARVIRGPPDAGAFEAPAR